MVGHEELASLRHVDLPSNPTRPPPSPPPGCFSSEEGVKSAEGSGRVGGFWSGMAKLRGSVGEGEGRPAPSRWTNLLAAAAVRERASDEGSDREREEK